MVTKFASIAFHKVQRNGKIFFSIHQTTTIATTTTLVGVGVGVEGRGILSCRYQSSSSIDSSISSTKGYQAMGSFHSEDVDELMAQDDDVYTIPELPFQTSSSSIITSSDDNNDFLLDQKTWTFLNHGAFGASLRVGYERADLWRLHLERQPLRYFDRDLLPHLVYSARRLATFCDAPTRDSITLIQNVTFGLNTILKGYSRVFSTKGKGNENQAHVILWDTSYGSLKKMAYRYCDKVTEIPVSKYFQNYHTMEDPSAIFEKALTDTLLSQKKGGVLDGNDDTFKNALLILDHTTSNTALTMPLESLSRLGKDLGMLVLVDGAHGLLAQELSFRNLPNVDFYVGNGHKWLSCPRGIGLLYCPHPTLRETVLEHPAVMSHGVGQGFQSRYLWDGCRDYAAALSVPAVLDYWEQQSQQQERVLGDGHGGAFETQQQMKHTLHEAVSLLGTMWGYPKEEATLAPLTCHAPMMALVKLPFPLQKSSAATSADAKAIQDYLYTRFIEAPIKCINGQLYVRISAHVYNNITEYERLGQVLSKLGV